MCNPSAPALCRQCLWSEPSLQDQAGGQKGLQPAGPPQIQLGLDCCLNLHLEAGEIPV